MAVVDDHVPLCKNRVRKNPCPWITDDIEELMQKRDHIHRTAIELNDNPLWDEYKTLRNRVNHMPRRQKSDCYRGIIRDCSKDSKKVWNCLKQIVPGSKKTSPTNIEVNGEDCRSPSSIADAFNLILFPLLPKSVLMHRAAILMFPKHLITGKLHLTWNQLLLILLSMKLMR